MGPEHRAPSAASRPRTSVWESPQKQPGEGPLPEGSHVPGITPGFSEVGLSPPSTSACSRFVSLPPALPPQFTSSQPPVTERLLLAPCFHLSQLSVEFLLGPWSPEPSCLQAALGTGETAGLMGTQEYGGEGHRLLRPEARSRYNLPTGLVLFLSAPQSRASGHIWSREAQ